jgi:DtxR family transcriptional regulator, Mn-dependent transcriptional regulator
VDEISPVAQDYLKAIWSATEWGGPPVGTTGLAHRFGTSSANVSETLRRLAGQGLVEYEPYKPVRLTAEGETHAIAMVRRHRLLETFLVSVLGYSWDEVHVEAERIEHAATDLLIERIDVFLDRPSADPHGDPIPAADGSQPVYPQTFLLSEVTIGRYEVVRVSDADPARLVRLAKAGMCPGAEVLVDDQGQPRATGLVDGDTTAVLVRAVGI